VVTIDGPAGAGKSTVARRLAARLGYAYVNSGAIYRAVAWETGRGRPLADVLRETRLEFRVDDRGQRVLVNGADVTASLYTPEISEQAAALSRRPEVRAFADALQRFQAERGPLVVEGRDAGTVVFPDADCKFYLDASLEARARRRLAELAEGPDAAARGGSGPGVRGSGPDLEATRSAIHARDVADQTRPVAPLARTDDARYVDSSEMTVDEVVARMAEEVERTCSTRAAGR
jgi:cytidylate kinase